MTATQPLPLGAFVRVRADHPTHGGLDAMVHRDFADGTMGVVFGFDRYNQGQHVHCVGPELWDTADFDLSTVEL